MLRDPDHWAGRAGPVTSDTLVQPNLGRTGKTWRAKKGRQLHEVSARQPHAWLGLWWFFFFFLCLYHACQSPSLH